MGSEMCIRDSLINGHRPNLLGPMLPPAPMLCSNTDSAFSRYALLLVIRGRLRRVYRHERGLRGHVAHEVIGVAQVGA